MSKFVVYEKVAEAIYKRVDKATASPGMQTTINLGSGLIAGFAAALVSQPADTMLSKINKSKGAPGEGTTSRLIKIAKELGLRVSSLPLLALCQELMLTVTLGFVLWYRCPSVHGRYHYRWSICNLRRHQESHRRRGRCGNCQISVSSSDRGVADAFMTIPKQDTCSGKGEMGITYGHFHPFVHLRPFITRRVEDMAGTSTTFGSYYIIFDSVCTFRSLSGNALDFFSRSLMFLRFGSLYDWYSSELTDLLLCSI